jgi:TonB family protein
LFARPEAGAPFVTLRPNEAPFVKAIAARVIATKGEFVEVEMLGTAEAFHCGSDGGYAQDFRGFVHERGVLDVTSSGTRVQLGELVLALPAGIAVDRSGPEMVLEFDGERLAAEVDEAALARSYRDAPRKSGQACLDEAVVARFVEAGAGHMVEPMRIGSIGRAVIVLDAHFESGERLGRLAYPLRDASPRPHANAADRKCVAFAAVSGVPEDAHVCAEAAEFEPTEQMPAHKTGASVGTGTHVVDGQLDLDIVRRIVRAHINEIRHCYNQGLQHDPDLRGGVRIDFVIAPNGDVQGAKVVKNDLADAHVGECIVKAIKRWRFPKSADGKPVRVSYPFQFANAG